MKIQIVLLSGKQGSGKTSITKSIIKTLHARPGYRAVMINFADPLRKMENFCWGMLEDVGFKRSEEVKVKDGKLMQLLGTEWGRDTVDTDIWVKYLQKAIEKEAIRLGGGNAPTNLVFLIGDCRFPNELAATPGALRVRLECAREVRKARAEMWRTDDTHRSEIGLDEEAMLGKFDVYLDTEAYDVEHCTSMIVSQLLKDSWMEKRK